MVLLHGFTQTGVSWRPVREVLADRMPSLRVHTPDLAGHGSADITLDGSDLVEMADQLVEAFGRAIWVGYSMGGRTALRLALDHPDAVAGLVLVGATAGIDDPDERAARRASDEHLAERIEADGVAAFLDRWLAQPLFADLEAAADDLMARRSNRPDGLAASLRRAGTGTMDPPWWGDLHRIGAPTRVIAGAEDAKFVGLGRRLAERIGSWASFGAFDGCGHAAHLERPDLLAAEVVELATRLPAVPGADDRGTVT